jgi:electron transfer flavoprotein alpha subunit
MAAVLGQGITAVAREAVLYGADTVYAAEAAALAHYQTLTYCGVMAQIAQQAIPNILLLGMGAIGRDLGSRLAFRLRTGLASDCAEATGVRLEDAEIVISGGRGLQSPKDFYGMLEPCAKVLRAALGASRAAVDEGWVPNQIQVGLTGKIISPKLYIACAISGAAQHMAGCGYAQTIVAVNRDLDAPIYQRATLGVVGDYKKVIPAFQKKCEDLLQ